MAILTIPQIAQLATNAGIPGGQPLYTCVAIALAESSGQTDVTNDNTDGTRDSGVWQINTVHDSTMPGADRFDPNVNAQLMATISSQGTNWQPWSTFNNGAYLEHMGAVMGTLGGSNFVPNGAGGTGSGAGNGLTAENVALISSAKAVNEGSQSSSISAFFHIITTAAGWLRILKVGTGLIIIVIAFLLMFGSTDVGKSAIKVAGVAAL